jgi:transposase
LNVSGILANGKLSKAIADMGFYEFRRRLEYQKRYGGKTYSAELKGSLNILRKVVGESIFDRNSLLAACSEHR